MALRGGNSLIFMFNCGHHQLFSLGAALSRKINFYSKKIPKRKKDSRDCLELLPGFDSTIFCKLHFKIHPNILHAFLEILCFINFTLRRMRCILYTEGH